MNRPRNVKMLRICRVILLILGMVAGAAIAYEIQQLFVYEFSLMITVMSYIASMFLLGGVFTLSAPMLLTIGTAIVTAIATRASAADVYDVSAIVLGFVAGGFMAIATEIVLSIALTTNLVARLAVGICVGVSVGVVVTKICAWILNVDTVGKVGLVERGYKGYILTYNALSSDKIVAVCLRWLESSVYVSSQTADAIELERAEKTAAAKNLEFLLKNDAVRVLPHFSYSSTKNVTAEIAASRKLKVIATKDDKNLILSQKPIIVLTLDEL